MSELKRTQFYDIHVAAGGAMVDFGGWEMPIQYPGGIIQEHLYTRSSVSLFDVSHMGRILVEGPERVKFLQRVLSSNVSELAVGRAQYAMIPNENGGVIDDAYLNRFEEDKLLLVVNASNKEKDLAHLRKEIEGYSCTITDISSEYAAIAVQGPKTDELLCVLSGGKPITDAKKNAVNIVSLEGHTVYAAKTGYTGEPLGYEIYAKNEDCLWLWNRLTEMGARPAGLGARDTLRLEAGLPLYGHEMGLAPDGSEIPAYAVSLAKFAVSFHEEKGDFIGRDALYRQYECFKRLSEKDVSDTKAIPRRIRAILLTGRGVIRAGMEVYAGGKHVGWVTSGTMIPYYVMEGAGDEIHPTEETGKRSIGFCYIDSTVPVNSSVEVDVRGKRIPATIPLRHLKQNTVKYAVPHIKQ